MLTIGTLFSLFPLVLVAIYVDIISWWHIVSMTFREELNK